jgi:hypothetical protein
MIFVLFLYKNTATKCITKYRILIQLWDTSHNRMIKCKLFIFLKKLN